MMAPGMTDDIDRIMAVMGSAFDPEFGEAWNRRQVEDALLLGQCHYFLAGPDGKPLNREDPNEQAAGFILSRTGFDEEELLLFAVNPMMRRQGIGDALLTRFAHAAKARGVVTLLLEMRRGNPAESLYRRHGFVPVGERPNYYRTLSGARLDAITFGRALNL